MCEQLLCSGVHVNFSKEVGAYVMRHVFSAIGFDTDREPDNGGGLGLLTSTIANGTAFIFLEDRAIRGRGPMRTNLWAMVFPLARYRYENYFLFWSLADTSSRSI
jgi:hypothetical protein